MKKIILSLTIAIASLGAVAQSDTTFNQESLFIDQVVVTGTRTAKKLSEAPIQTTLVRAREIQQAGATTAMEALLDNIPGIVTSQNAMGNNLRIRGLNTNYILFLVDGERMVSEGAGGNINLDQIDVNSIERIEIVNGAASALYGSNAVGAVINIITKKPKNDFEGNAAVSYSDYNTIKTRLGLATKLDHFTASASGFYNTSKGYDLENGPYSAAYDDLGADLRVGYEPSKNFSAAINGRYFRHEVYNPANALMYSHPLSHNVTVGGNIGYLSNDEKYSLTVSSNFTNYFDMEYDEEKFVENLDGRASYLSTRIVNTYNPSEKWEFVGGLEQNHEESYSTSLYGGTPKTEVLDDYNLFAQAQYSPVKNFDIVAGARYTYNTRYKSAFTPKLSLMYKLGSFTFRGGVGTAFRAPTVKELYYDFYHSGGGGFWVYGNPNLKAENGLYNSLSAEYAKGKFYFSVSGYWNEITDKIDQYTVIDAQGEESRYYTNVSSATLRGVDVNVSYNLLNQVMLKGSYSFCDAVDNSTGLQLESNVRHSGTFSATWNSRVIHDFPFSLQFSGRLTSPRLYQSAYTDATGAQVIEKTQSNPYDIWKVTLVKPFQIAQHNLELTLKCDNVFNFKDVSFIDPGRTFLVGLRYTFK